jgi:hypothetical protein
MRGVRTAAGALAAAAALAGTGAAAASLPAAFGSAKQGSLSVSSSVLLAPRQALMQGVWLDPSRPCAESHAVRVTVQIFWRRGAAHENVRRSKVGTVDNCAEGGPNFGFTLSARGRGLSCANGKWKPGLYSFVTRTEDTVTGLIAIASLDHRITSC